MGRRWESLVVGHIPRLHVVGSFRQRPVCTGLQRRGISVSPGCWIAVEHGAVDFGQSWGHAWWTSGTDDRDEHEHERRCVSFGDVYDLGDADSVMGGDDFNSWTYGK